MNHKDKIAIEKIIAELNVADDLVQGISLEDFMSD